jgi:ATP phosphoribosyltransferase regulatory subunit
MSALRHLEPHGVDTLLGEEVEFQESLTALFRDRFRQYGYRPVLTPTFEYLDLFREAESLSGDDMVKLIARDGRDTCSQTGRDGACKPHDGQAL